MCKFDCFYLEQDVSFMWQSRIGLQNGKKTQKLFLKKPKIVKKNPQNLLEKNPKGVLLSRRNGIKKLEKS